MELINQRIDGRFQVLKRIGGGSFGQVFLGREDKSRKDVAIKLEPVSSPRQYLLYEAKLMKSLHGVKGVPRVIWSGIDDNYNVLVMDLLGPNIHKKYEACRLKFSTKDFVQIGVQMLERLESVHEQCYIHRDIKPENFTLGIGPGKDTVYLIDFGLAKKYCDMKTKQHVPYRENKSMTGTARYASVNAHLGLEQSRRDDLEALMYMLVYFLKGELPWQNIKTKTKNEKYGTIMERKMTVSIDVLCKGLPGEIGTMLKYVKSIRFDEQPNYALLRGNLMKIAEVQRVRVDFVFEWTLATSPSSLDVPVQIHRRKKRLPGRRESLLSSCVSSSAVNDSESNSSPTGHSLETAIGRLPALSAEVRKAAKMYSRPSTRRNSPQRCIVC